MKTASQGAHLSRDHLPLNSLFGLWGGEVETTCSSSGYSVTCSVDQTGLELTEIHMPLQLKTCATTQGSLCHS